MRPKYFEKNIELKILPALIIPYSFPDRWKIDSTLVIDRCKGGREGGEERARVKVHAHRRSSGAKGNHLVETAGVWESAAIRQTSLAPADYLKARSPPQSPPPPTISFPKSVARIIKLVEERRRRGGGGGKTSFLATQPCQTNEDQPSPSPATSDMLYLDLSLHLLVLPLSLFPFFLSLFHVEHIALPLSYFLLDTFYSNSEVFVRKGTDRGQASFEFRSRVTVGVDLKICSPLARRRPEVVQLESYTV